MTMVSTEEREDKEWPAVRIVHLTGGCRAICGLETRFEVLPKALSDNVISADLSDYGALYDNLESHNLEIIGVDFFSDARVSLVRWRKEELQVDTSARYRLMSGPRS